MLCYAAALCACCVALTASAGTALLERYCADGDQGKEEVPRELLLSQSEAYVEYTAEGGRVRKADSEKARAKTKYDEDGLCCNSQSSNFPALDLRPPLCVLITRSLCAPCNSLSLEPHQCVGIVLGEWSVGVRVL